MKIISKVVVWILSLIVVFIITNLILGCFHYKGINNYIQVLVGKDWLNSISDLTPKNPISIFTIFYEEGDINLKDIDKLGQVGNISDIKSSTDVVDVTNGAAENNDIDPYDPEFENEFNSFFGGENSEMNSSMENYIGNTDQDIIQGDTIGENILDDEYSVAEELIKKFNE